MYDVHVARVFRGHNGPVNLCDVADSGLLIVSAGNDGRFGRDHLLRRCQFIFSSTDLSIAFTFSRKMICCVSLFPFSSYVISANPLYTFISLFTSASQHVLGFTLANVVLCSLFLLLFLFFI